MDLLKEYKEDILKFLDENSQRFEDSLLEQAVNVRDKIKEIDAAGNINLLDNAKKLVSFIVQEDTAAIRDFAKQEGKIWAGNRLTLAFKLEWIQAIRRTFWRFIEEFVTHVKGLQDLKDFFQAQERIDHMVDLFTNGFFLSYSTCKDELIEKQQKKVDNLSVPIIPITDKISILPLIGTLDNQLVRVLEEKILTEIGKSKMRTLIVDLSGIADTGLESMDYFSRLMEATKMMGCEPIISGLRPNIVQQMIRMDIHYFKGTTKDTLQQALHEKMTSECNEEKLRL